MTSRTKNMCSHTDMTHMSHTDNDRPNQKHVLPHPHTPDGGYGYLPKAHSTKVSPKLHMSLSNEYSSPLIRSGDMYVTVPTCAHLKRRKETAVICAHAFEKKQG